MVGVALVAQQQRLVLDDRLLARRPAGGLERVERVEPAALDPDVEDAVEEEAAAVDVAAVVLRPRHRLPPELLAAAERHGAERRDRGVVHGLGVAAPRAGDDDVLVVRARRSGVLEHRRAALDDVVELVRPDDLAGGGVDLAQVVVVAAGHHVGLAAVDDDAGLAGPAAAGVLARGVLLVLARAHAAAELGLPEDVEVLGRRSLPVVPAPVVAQERADLDAVAGHRGRGRRRHRTGLRLLLDLAAATAAARAGGGAPDEEDRQDGDDEERDAAPAPQLALTLS